MRNRSIFKERRKKERRGALTAPQVAWATAQMESLGRTLKEVAEDLGCHVITLERRMGLRRRVDRERAGILDDSMTFRCPECGITGCEPICPRCSHVINPAILFARKLATQDLRHLGADDEDDEQQQAEA